MSFVCQRRHQGRVRAVLLDRAGTTMDFGAAWRRRSCSARCSSAPACRSSPPGNFFLKQVGIEYHPEWAQKAK